VWKEKMDDRKVMRKQRERLEEDCVGETRKDIHRNTGDKENPHLYALSLMV
jgi:hypothetical protein